MSSALISREFTPILESKRKATVKSTQKSFVKNASMATIIAISSVTPAGGNAFVSPIKEIDQPRLRISFGGLTSGNTQSKEPNSNRKFAIQVLKNGYPEYTILSNAVHLEASSMMAESNQHIRELKDITGNVEFIGYLPKRERRITEEEITKQAKELKSVREITGSVEFIGKIPKRPRI